MAPLLERKNTSCVFSTLVSIVRSLANLHQEAFPQHHCRSLCRVDWNGIGQARPLSRKCCTAVSVIGELQKQNLYTSITNELKQPLEEKMADMIW